MTNHKLAERDKALEEKDKLLIETRQEVKQRESQLGQMRMRMKQLDEVTTEKSNSGENVLMIFIFICYRFILCSFYRLILVIYTLMTFDCNQCC